LAAIQLGVQKKIVVKGKGSEKREDLALIKAQKEALGGKI